MPDSLLLPPLSKVIEHEGKGNFAIKRYYKWPFSFFYRHKLKMILDMMDSNRTYSHILDFGCGPAMIFNETLKKRASKVTGIDVNDEIGTKKEYDLIVCASSLEFVNNLDYTLKRLNKLLLPGQALIGASPMQNRITRFYFDLIGDKNIRNPHQMILNSLHRNFFLVRKKEWFGLYFSWKAYAK